MYKPKDPEQTRRNIVAAATHEFAERGVMGARLDAIAQRTQTTRAMIYYYFNDREGLYKAVLEDAYRKIRDAERELDLGHVPPIAAMGRLVDFVFDYYQANPNFVALVVAENQTGGRYIRKLRKMQRFNLSIIDTLSDVLERGARCGVFRPGLDPIDVHMSISALGLFQIANRHTFGYIFRRKLSDPRYVARHRDLVRELVLRYVGVCGSEARAAKPQSCRRATSAHAAR